jgi:hypothetical protein
VLTLRLRDRDDIARDLVGVAGLTALVIGLVILAPSKAIGFDAHRALNGILDQLPVTLPAALLMLLVTAVDLGAGLVLARFIRRSPFDSVTDAALSAMVATVLKDLAFLAILAQVGLFRSPILWITDAAILAAAWRVRPLFAQRDWRPSLERLGSLPLAVLIGIVWAGPILLQLASSVVPFIDVLPNHVAPAEHLRTFGSFGPLTATQSPIYGPSRSLLGYIGLLGTLTTMSGLPATLALSAFILPSTILVGIGAYRLATVVAGSAAGPLALLAFALTGTFARLSDDRGTVIVLPLVAWTFALMAKRMRAEPEASSPALSGAHRVEPMLSDGVLLGLGLAAAIFIHPIIGALAVATVGIVAVAMPERAGRLGISAVLTAAIAAIPQLTTMVGIPLPTSFAIAGIPLAILAGDAIGRATVLHRPLLRVLRWTPVLLIPIAVLSFSSLEPALNKGARPLVEATSLLLLVALVGAIVGAAGARSPLVLAGAAIGLAVAFGTQLVPVEGTGLLGQALRFELPKTLYYWFPAVVAVGSAAALAWLWQAPALPWLARVGAVGLFVVFAAVPLRATTIDDLHLGEHRFSEALAIDLRWTGTGYWTGYPDSRNLVDPPRRALIDAVQAEIDAGRIGPDTPILHVAKSFQQWVATPLGVFTGVTETDVSPDAEHSIHTVGGRLLDFKQLPDLLASRSYPYLLFEPNKDLPAGIDQEIAAAGYGPIFTNSQGTLYRLGGQA